MIKEEQAKAEPPKDEPPLGTGIKESGPGGFGLGGGTGNGRMRGTAGNGGKWDWYANQVQGRVAEAMQRNLKPRTTKPNVTVRVWPDSSGHVSRARLAGTGTVGNPSLDSAIRDEVLSGLQLQSQPSGMPITLRLAARRP